jgi:hypothetical protein
MTNGAGGLVPHLVMGRIDGAFFAAAIKGHPGHARV